MTPALRAAGRVAIALALETAVVLAWRAGHIGPLFTGLCTLACTAFAWPWLAHQLGRFNTWLLLSLVYVLGAGPTKLFRFMGRPAPDGPSYWKAKPAPDPAIPERRRFKWQF